jgi:hypothetical protein
MSDDELLAIKHSRVLDAALLVAAIQTLEARSAKKEGDRHTEIQAQLAELKKPHPTVWPNFAFTVISAIAAVAAAYFAWQELHREAPQPHSLTDQQLTPQISQPQKAPVGQKP